MGDWTDAAAGTSLAFRRNPLITDHSPLTTFRQLLPVHTQQLHMPAEVVRPMAGDAAAALGAQGAAQLGEDDAAALRAVVVELVGP